MLYLVLIAIFVVANGEMGYALKAGVFGRIRDEMKPAIAAVERVWAQNGMGTPVITSIEDGNHMRASKHEEGLAHDWRLNTIPLNLHRRLADQVAMILGPNFDVIHEAHGEANDHLHIEFDPKGTI